MSRPGIVLALFAALALPLPVSAIEKDLPFALDQWIELKTTEGPVTLHRVRLASQSGLTKSKFIRPGSAKYGTDVQIQLEFSNEATEDWEARIRFEWIDAGGTVIDGFDGTETLDSETKFEQQTVSLSTLRYGLDMAKKMRLVITVERD